MADVLATVDSIFMDTHVSMRVRKASAFVQLPRWETWSHMNAFKKNREAYYCGARASCDVRASYFREVFPAVTYAPSAPVINFTSLAPAVTVGTRVRQVQEQLSRDSGFVA